MITIAKYNAPRQRATVVNNETITTIEQAAEQAASQTAQKVAAQTATEITMSATVNADGYLIMTTDITAAAEEQEATTG